MSPLILSCFFVSSDQKRAYRCYDQSSKRSCKCKFSYSQILIWCLWFCVKPVQTIGWTLCNCSEFTLSYWSPFIYHLVTEFRSSSGSLPWGKFKYWMMPIMSVLSSLFSSSSSSSRATFVWDSGSSSCCPPHHAVLNYGSQKGVSSQDISHPCFLVAHLLSLLFSPAFFLSRYIPSKSGF